MQRIGEITWKWLDAVGWCDCRPPKDHCDECRQKRAEKRAAERAQERAAPKAPKVFTGTSATPRKLDWDE